jgi:hypothetical protein
MIVRFMSFCKPGVTLRQVAEEPVVPLVPRPEEDEYGVVEILDVMPPKLFSSRIHFHVKLFEY